MNVGLEPPVPVLILHTRVLPCVSIKIVHPPRTAVVKVMGGRCVPRFSKPPDPLCSARGWCAHAPLPQETTASRAQTYMTAHTTSDAAPSGPSESTSTDHRQASSSIDPARCPCPSMQARGIHDDSNEAWHEQAPTSWLPLALPWAAVPRSAPLHLPVTPPSLLVENSVPVDREPAPDRGIDADAKGIG